MTDNRESGYKAVSLKAEAAEELKLLAADLTGILRRRVTISQAVMMATEIIGDMRDEDVKAAIDGIEF
jgi:hypothetical protein